MGSDTTTWQLADVVDTDGHPEPDGRPELVRVQQSGNHDLDVVSLQVRETRLTRSSNGIGASEEITYGTVAEADRDMPLGLLPHVVKTVGVHSVLSSGPYDALTQYLRGGHVLAKPASLPRLTSRERPPPAVTARSRGRHIDRAFPRQSAAR